MVEFEKNIKQVMFHSLTTFPFTITTAPLASICCSTRASCFSLCTSAKSWDILIPMRVLVEQPNSSAAMSLAVKISEVLALIVTIALFCRKKSKIQRENYLYFSLLLSRQIQLNHPLTPINDQDRISPYNINTISSRQVMRIKKNINQGIIS